MQNTNIAGACSLLATTLPATNLARQKRARTLSPTPPHTVVSRTQTHCRYLVGAPSTLHHPSAKQRQRRACTSSPPPASHSRAAAACLLHRSELDGGSSADHTHCRCLVPGGKHSPSPECQEEAETSTHIESVSCLAQSSSRSTLAPSVGASYRSFTLQVLGPGRQALSITRVPCSRESLLMSTHLMSTSDEHAA